MTNFDVIGVNIKIKRGIKGEKIKMRDKGIWKILAIFMVLVTIVSCAAMPSAGGVSESEVTSSSATIYVPDGYSTIQEAVDAASAGDTIIVRDGTYIENIEVDKSLTIRSENGSDSTIVLGSPGGNGFEVITNYVTISGFIIEGASFSCGILISGVNNCNISNNIVSGNLQGIYLSKSSRNMIFNNTAFSNENCGIILNDSSTQNQIIKNNVSNNLNYQGILLLSSSENIIANNTAKNNGENGIYLEESNSNRITGNDASNNVNYNGISLDSSTDNEISNNIANSNHYHGIGLFTSSENIIANNTAKNNGNNGVFLKDSNKNRITDNDASSNVNYNGIELSSSSNNEIHNNIANSNYYSGIGLFTSSENIIANNTAKNNGDNGIYLEESNNNIVMDNNASNNYWHGISLGSSSNNTFTGNTASNNNQDGLYLEDSHSNTITGNNASNNGDNGIHLYESDNSRVTDNNALNNDNYNGIELNSSKNNEIRNNIANSNYYQGIGLWTSNENVVANNTAKNNGDNGIYLEESKNNTVTDNNANGNDWNGISMFSLSGNTIMGNTARNNNQSGIWIEESTGNTIRANNASNNEYGICLYNSSSNTLRNNLLYDNRYNFGVEGYSYSDFDNDIDTSNTVDGKPIYYWIGWQDEQIPDDAGVVGVVNSINITVRDLTLTNNLQGVLFAYTINSKIENVTASNNWDGIRLMSSSNNTLTNNNASGNDGDGIWLWDSSNYNTLTNNTASNNNHSGIRIEESNSNKIYFNNFINNTDNVYSENSTNFWNSTSKITYTYNEKTYTNYTGNYWGDYTGTDTNNNGICDTPYSINSDNDNYPLMQPWQNYFPEENEAKENNNPKLAFSSYYQPINISVNLSVPPYPLPLNLSNITNINEINAKFWLSEREKELLRTNGFVITDYGCVNDIVAPYEDMKRRDIPIFVTTDTLLHLYHIQFNEILKGIEEREFFDELVDMSKAMLEQSIQDHENFVDPEMKEAARRNVAYFAVALKLLQTPTDGYDEERLKREIEEWNTKYPWDKKTFKPIKKVEFEIPDYVKGDVEKEIGNIEQHDGFHPSVIFNSDPNCICDYPCCYCEDYSQYVPRGHYTRSEKLKRYFNAMMWYGRMAFLLKGGDDALISEQDAKISTIQAALISSELPDVNVGNKTAQEIWDRIYSVTAFFVGTADDLTPYEYRDAMNNVFGAEFNVSKLSTADNLLKLKVELAKMRSPEIYGGSGVCVVYPPITEEELYKCLNKTKGMRFMGQRFVPDSYMFQQLVSPAVGTYVGNNTPFTMCITDAGRARCFPRGLDIMAVLGSEMAEDILIEEGDTEYAGINTSYDKQLKELKSQFAGFDITEWNRNLYWSWLYTLKPLLKQFEDGYPTFMQTKAWQEKELQTSLASWTELRHDTILYAKQSYTPGLGVGIPPEPKPVRGYVEPVPEFYARLLALTEMTEKGLIDLDVLDATEKARLQSLERILERLIDISKAELENKELNESDYEFIRNFGENLDSVVAGVDVEGKETTIVADVHTDCNTGKVLEEGVGYVNLILVAYSVPDGRIIVGAGPVFSYYEFKQEMKDRLTDKKWKEMLRSNPPERPGWVKGIEAD